MAQNVLSGLFGQIYRGINKVIYRLVESFDLLAKELGKEKPVISISGISAFVNEKGEALLKKCLIHIVRNSLDHGIETPEERVNSGKPPYGTIKVELKREHDALILSFCDDGRGLNMEKLRKIAVKRGNSEMVSCDEKLGELVFLPEVSTKEKVSEISGRGIGMSAIRSYFESSGGSVKINLTGGKEGDKFRPFAIRMVMSSNIFIFDSKWEEMLAKKSA
ncbi:MAG: hypothetical protein HQK54_09135 [Oligoflexales bacterium]|nr:hypothetical protein [Oligoflexales bacterium]